MKSKDLRIFNLKYRYLKFLTVHPVEHPSNTTRGLDYKRTFKIGHFETGILGQM